MRQTMERIEKSIEVGCPVGTVYNQWTQFEEFPRFMEGVEEVRQLDDTHLRWRATVAGKEKQWDAEIVEQVPDRRIAWRSTSGAPNSGVVRFEPLGPDRTRVWLTMQYDPEGVAEVIGDALGLMSGKIEKTLESFKRFIESRGAETGGWRGEVHGGRTTRSAGEGAPEARGEAVRSTAERHGRPLWDETFGMVRRMAEDMDRVLAGFGWPSRLGRWRGDERTWWSPHVELEQRGDQLVVTADLPGVKREDIKLEIDDSHLILQGERRSEREAEEGGIFRTEREYGTFYRSIPLPESVDAASAKASMENGVLRVSVRAPRPPRREGHRLTIEGA